MQYSDKLGRSWDIKFALNYSKKQERLKPLTPLGQLLNPHLQKGRADSAKMVQEATATHFSLQATTGALVSVVAAGAKRGEEEHGINCWSDATSLFGNKQLVTGWQN